MGGERTAKGTADERRKQRTALSTDYTDDADLNRELHWEPPMDAENSELPYPQITQISQI